MPCLMPYGHTRQADRREAGLLGTQAIFDVIKLDEHGHRKSDLLDHRGWNQAHPPAIEVLVDALVTVRRIAKRFHGEIMVVPHALRRVHPLVHAPGETTGTAQIRLLNICELLPQIGSHLGKVFLVLYQIASLIGAIHRIQTLTQCRCASNGTQLVHAIRGTIECCDGDGHGRFMLCHPGITRN